MNSTRQDGRLGCKHYPRGCQILSPCCNKWFGCRLCHNENANCGVETMDRHQIKRVQCLSCNHEQNVQPICEKCNKSFGRYFCGKCNFFDDTFNKKLYHCDECGICRVGKAEDFIHCKACNLCTRPVHTCTKVNVKEPCVVCMEELFSSRSGSLTIKCGHPICYGCYKNMLKNHLYQCPLCKVSMVDLDNEAIDEEIKAMPMPEDYPVKEVEILCNECHNKEKVNFHFYGLKCTKCNSYNTTQI
ncbi:RING finger and CHY zinc finger domain-containing protein [Acrasis kona]|uniref:RING finger and CHY zinc finger domain-containing protein n=1 Tax=Acrasis kona TaxID=1008807 RepID=A0AAW2Z5Z7_9EUKA